MLALTGFGTGVRSMPGTRHGVGYFRSQIAAVVSIMNFAISFGGTLASTIMLNLFDKQMSNAGISFGSGESASASTSNTSASCLQAKEITLEPRPDLL